MIHTIVIGLIAGGLFLAEALRQIRCANRRASARNRLNAVINHGFTKPSLTEEKITELRASRWDGGQ